VPKLFTESSTGRTYLQDEYKTKRALISLIQYSKELENEKTFQHPQPKHTQTKTKSDTEKSKLREKSIG
jgi:hypothetical protein